ncbi:hypothetical protein ABPG72_009055 [Tetrahymena utriculariae]
MIENQTDYFINQVVQQLNQVKDLQITDIRKGKEGFGKYLFATYQQNPCMVKIISLQNDESLLKQNKLQKALEKVNRLKQCSHKNILKYYDSFQFEDNFFIVMEKGECSLQKFIDDNRRNLIDKEQFLKFALQMVEVADYLHQKKYILSNINLKNIFLDRDLNIKLSTFTVKQEVNVLYLLKKQIFALENNQLFFFPMCLIDEGDNQNLVILSIKQDMYTIGLCLYCLTGALYMDILNYIQGGRFQVNVSLGADINQLLQLMLFRSCYNFIPSPCYFIQSFQQIIQKIDKQYKQNDDQGLKQDTFQMNKEDEVNYLKLFQEVVIKVDNIIQKEEEEEELSGDGERSEEIQSKNSEEIDRTIEKIWQLSSFNQNYDIPYFFLGHYYDLSQDYQQSLFCYQKALEINDKNDIAMYGVGLAYNELGFIEESLSFYDKYVNLNPLDDEVYSNIGEIYLNQKDFNKSKIYFEKSLEINSRQYIAYFNIGQLYFQQKMFQKGAYYLKKANKIQSDDDTFYLLGYFYEQKQDYEKSLKCYEKSSKSSQSDEQYINLIHNVKQLI